ncbi:dynamin family protein [Marinithermofilum abyssi]|nr:dynamin family protein [Marinithermofilum abyssi]
MMLETKPSTQLRRWAAVYQHMQQNGGDEQAQQWLEVMKKRLREEYVIAFCGHFSAGKSSMLNRLYGKPLLPSSPIPTSANLVGIRKGDDRVCMTLRSGLRQEFRGIYTDEQLKQLCKNGDEVIAVEVYRKDAPFPENVILLDTPGIDSTDEAHRLATESALHLSDHIFYIMDYNHVQSEVNLAFIKELQQRGKVVSLIVNQIDKHRGEELPFHVYQEKVKASFRQWDIQAADIFYTTLREPDHPWNEMNRLQKRLEDLIKHRYASLAESAEKEFRFLMNDYVKHRRQQAEETIAEWEQKRDPSFSLSPDVLEEWQQEKEELQRRCQRLSSDFLEGLDNILQNAYLMPYEMREAAHSFLETVMTKFKVGFFFAKSKTEQEKARRLQVFIDRLGQTVETQLDVHVKQYILQYLKKHGVYTEERGEAIYALSNPVTPELVRSVVKEGAGLTGDYLLKYTEDVASAVKKAYRDQGMKWFADFSGDIKQRLSAKERDLEANIRRWEEQAAIQDRIDQLQRSWESERDRLHRLLEGEEEGDLPADWEQWLEEEDIESLSHWQAITTPSAETSEAGESRAAALVTVDRDLGQSDRKESVIRLGEEAAAAMQRVEAVDSIRRELIRKQERARQRKFTVALFGAFSAGKSSFANALIGDNILPVSPHPTTAAINMIAPPTEEHSHGQVKVRFKTRERLTEDVRQAFRLFGKQVADLESAVQEIPSLLATETPNKRQKTALPFLQAVMEGFENIYGHLGKVIVRNLDSFGEYIADETKSCFVESAVLYYDCPLTQQGVTLVDTPGADSMNARHTEVAFEYIRNADAILFVTYYNHAFSRADREFLIQLGRVKDAFAMDKMFFIMNAADLAATPEERAEVESYLRERLVHYGIRQPRLYPLSSLAALKEKQGNVAGVQVPGISGSGIAEFEADFQSFLMGDLLSLSLHGIRKEVTRGHRALENILGAARKNKADKEQQKRELEQKQTVLLESLNQWDTRTVEHALRQETEELLYYVKQRLFLRYNDVFLEIVHPSVLRDGTENVKALLKDCAMEVTDFLRQDLLQELRATSIRLERWLESKLESTHQEWLEQGSILEEGITLTREETAFSTPSLAPPLPDWNGDAFKKVLAPFNRSQTFIDREEKNRLREAMRTVLEEAVSTHLEAEGERIFTHYREEWEKGVKQWKDGIRRDVEDHYGRLLTALTEEVDVSAVERVADTLKRIDQEMAELLQS